MCPAEETHASGKVWFCRSKRFATTRQANRDFLRPASMRPPRTDLSQIYVCVHDLFTRRLPTSPRALLVRTGMRFCDFDLPNWAREIYRPLAREQQASMARALRLHRAEAALDCRS